MKHASLLLPVALGLLCAGTLRADAGQRYPASAQEVTIDVTSRYAMGTLSGARASADSNQWIECAVVTSGGSSSTFCYAENAAGVVRSCATSDAATAQVALGIKGDSMVQFNWDTTGKCTTLYVDNSSRFSPKAP